jgi:hypothetical protein
MVFALAAVAALAAFSNTAQAAHTAAEVHMFFGDPNVGAPGAATFTPGANPVAMAEPGDTVWFPLFLQNLAGDFAHNTAGYGLTLMTDEGLQAVVAGTSATQLGVLNGASSVGSADTSLTATIAGGTWVGPDRRSLHTGYQEAIGGLADVIGTAAGAVHVGYMGIEVGAAATDETIPLYLAVATGFGLDAAGSITVGFGWDGAEPNTFRYQNDNADVIGTTPLHTSTVEDASIRVIPEPATFGLLSLGLLAIRRRRNA